VDFCRQDYSAALSVALKSLSDHLFTSTATVNIRGVQEVDLPVNRAVNDIHRFGLCRLATKHHATKTLDTDLHPRSA
jgi:hypothetical protein